MTKCSFHRVRGRQPSALLLVVGFSPLASFLSFVCPSSAHARWNTPLSSFQSSPSPWQFKMASASSSGQVNHNFTIKFTVSAPRDSRGSSAAASQPRPETGLQKHLRENNIPIPRDLHACSYGCEWVFDPELGTIVSREGVAAPPESYESCPRRSVILIDSDRSGKAAGAIGPQRLPLILRAARVLNKAERDVERDDHPMKLGDHTLIVPKSYRPGGAHKIIGMGLEYLQAGVATISAIVDVTMGLSRTQAAALPHVRLRVPLGNPTGPESTPMQVAAAMAMRHVVTAGGLMAIANHANIASSAWRSASIAAWVPGPDGNPIPSNFFWKIMTAACEADMALRLHSELHRIDTSITEALAGIASSDPITLHGATASLAAFAPRIGCLISARRDGIASPLLAASWREVHDALTAAAAATRKEYKAVGTPVASAAAAAAEEDRPSRAVSASAKRRRAAKRRRDQQGAAADLEKDEAGDGDHTPVPAAPSPVRPAAKAKKGARRAASAPGGKSRGAQR